MTEKFAIRGSQTYNEGVIVLFRIIVMSLKSQRGLMEAHTL